MFSPFCSTSFLSPLSYETHCGLRESRRSKGGRGNVRRFRHSDLPLWPALQELHKVLVQREGVRNVPHRGENATEPVERQKFHCRRSGGRSLHDNHDFTQGQWWRCLLVCHRQAREKCQHQGQAPSLPHRYDSYGHPNPIGTKSFPIYFIDPIMQKFPCHLHIGTKSNACFHCTKTDST